MKVIHCDKLPSCTLYWKTDGDDDQVKYYVLDYKELIQIFDLYYDVSLTPQNDQEQEELILALIDFLSSESGPNFLHEDLTHK